MEEGIIRAPHCIMMKDIGGIVVAERSQSDEFTTLLMSQQRRLYLYIATFVPHPHDVDDILQRVNAVLLAKASEFTPGSNFEAWASTTARFEIMSFRKSAGRDRLVFSGEVIDALSADADEMEDATETRRIALSGCLEKLKVDDRQLIDRRYSHGTAVREMATESGRPLKSIYRSLERIRMALLACIERTISHEEDAS